MSITKIPLEPSTDCALVELAPSEYGDIAVAEKKYDTKTSGIVVAVSPGAFDYLVGRRVYFEEYRDGVRAEHEDKTYAFIKLEDIRGSEKLN